MKKLLFIALQLITLSQIRAENSTEIKINGICYRCEWAPFTSPQFTNAAWVKQNCFKGPSEWCD